MTLWTSSHDGLPLAYSATGSGPVTVVFIHGWCGDRQIWSQQVAALKDDYSTISLDLAGHGQSGGSGYRGARSGDGQSRNDQPEATRSRWSMAAFGADVASIVEAAGAERVILIAHSMGGDVMVDAALRLQGRVCGLIGVDTLWNVSREISPELIEQTLEPFLADYSLGAEAYVRNLFLPRADPELVEDLVRSILTVPAAVGCGALEEILLYRPTLRENLRRLDIPVLLLNSSDWRETDMASAQAYGLQVRTLAGVGHFSMLEAPEAVNRALAAVISEILVPEIVVPGT